MLWSAPLYLWWPLWLPCSWLCAHGTEGAYSPQADIFILAHCIARLMQLSRGISANAASAALVSWRRRNIVLPADVAFHAKATLRFRSAQAGLGPSLVPSRPCASLTSPADLHDPVQSFVLQGTNP